jgi:hypothetical protein
MKYLTEFTGGWECASAGAAEGRQESRELKNIKM